MRLIEIKNFWIFRLHRVQLRSNLTLHRDIIDSNPVADVILSQLHCAFCVDDSNKILLTCLYV